MLLTAEAVAVLKHAPESPTNGSTSVAVRNQRNCNAFISLSLPEPVLYDFIHSDCDDFEEYVQAISEPEDEDHEESAEDLYDFPIDDFHIPINPYEPEE